MCLQVKIHTQPRAPGRQCHAWWTLVRVAVVPGTSRMATRARSGARPCAGRGRRPAPNWGWNDLSTASARQRDVRGNGAGRAGPQVTQLVACVTPAGKWLATCSNASVVRVLALHCLQGVDNVGVPLHNFNGHPTVRGVHSCSKLSQAMIGGRATGRGGTTPMSPMLTLPQQQVLCAHFIGCKHKPRLLGVSGLPITNGAWVCLDMASHPRTLLGKAVTRSQGSRLHGTAPCSDETRSPANHCCRQITWYSKCNHGKHSHEGSTHRQQVGAIRALTKGLHKKSVHWASCGVALASSVHTPPMQLPVATKTPLQWRRSRRHWGVPTGWGEGLLAPRSGHTGAKKGGGGSNGEGEGQRKPSSPSKTRTK